MAARGARAATGDAGVGVLAPVSPDEELLRGFRQGLKQAGFVEGDNVSMLYHFAENEIDRLPALADDLEHIPITFTHILHARNSWRIPVR